MAPVCRTEVLHCVEDGDLVAIHKVFCGRRIGSVVRRPSGNPVEFRVMDLTRTCDQLWKSALVTLMNASSSRAMSGPVGW